jgi:hypothetical protein
MRERWRMVAGVALLVGAAGLTAPVLAQNSFFNLFSGFGAPAPAPPPPIVQPFVHQAPRPPRQAHRTREAHSSEAHSNDQAWCVRACDGRYFPINGPDEQSKAASCKSFCPASRTALVYGNDIAHAATQAGKPYSELPNAFKYRTEVVTGCTCNGKDQAGLAPVSIDKDPTLRNGDIVASADGLVIAHPGSGKHAEVNFTPVPHSMRARFQQVRVMARE